MAGVVDTYVAFRFIKLLSTPFEETDAYKLGIIDANGKVLKKRAELSTSAERRAYTIFDTIAFNIKKIFNRVPGLKTRLGSFAAALFLLKEHTQMSEEQFLFLEKSCEDWCRNNYMPVDKTLTEAAVFIEGTYRYKGRTIHVPRTESVATVLGVPLFNVKVDGKTFVVPANELEEDIANVAGSGQVAGLKFPPPVSKKVMVQRRKGMTGPKSPVGLEGY